MICTLKELEPRIAQAQRGNVPELMNQLFTDLRETLAAHERTAVLLRQCSLEDDELVERVTAERDALAAGLTEALDTLAEAPEYHHFGTYKRIAELRMLLQPGGPK